VTLYHETTRAFEGLLDAIRAARHHVHLEYYTFRSDDTGRRVVDLLAEKARAGVQVRLLYDSAGTLFLSTKMLRPLVQAGGMVRDFLPINPLRSWIRINLRNHRKITVIDGAVGFTGGMILATNTWARAGTTATGATAFCAWRGPPWPGCSASSWRTGILPLRSCSRRSAIFPP